MWSSVTIVATSVRNKWQQYYFEEDSADGDKEEHAKNLSSTEANKPKKLIELLYIQGRSKSRLQQH